MTRGELADQLMAATAGLRRLVRRRLRDDLPGPTLRGAHVELLRVVEEQPGLGVAAAARELHLAGNSVSTLVNQLVDLGMLRRETDPTDRRAACLHLTPDATARLERWRQARRNLVGGALDGLTPDELDAIEQAIPALRRLVARLADQPGAADVGRRAKEEA